MPMWSSVNNAYYLLAGEGSDLLRKVNLKVLSTDNCVNNILLLANVARMTSLQKFIQNRDVF